MKRLNRIPVAQEFVKPNDEVFFIAGDVSSLDVRPQVIQPPQPATFPTSLETCTEDDDPNKDQSITHHYHSTAP